MGSVGGYSWGINQLETLYSEPVDQSLCLVVSSVVLGIVGPHCMVDILVSSKDVSQTSFGHISTNSSTIPMVLIPA